MKKEDALADISVDMSTGKIAYPAPPGFKLDMEKVYRSAALFAPHCQTTEQAIKLAIHEQLSAHSGMASIRRMGVAS